MCSSPDRRAIRPKQSCSFKSRDKLIVGGTFLSSLKITWSVLLEHRARPALVRNCRLSDSFVSFLQNLQCWASFVILNSRLVPQCRDDEKHCRELKLYLMFFFAPCCGFCMFSMWVVISVSHTRSYLLLSSIMLSKNWQTLKESLKVAGVFPPFKPLVLVSSAPITG